MNTIKGQNNKYNYYYYYLDLVLKINNIYILDVIITEI
jgi:hypothetical protein